MGRGKNTFSLAAGFNITGQQPIDSRLVVDAVSDLVLAETWNGVGLYNGLVVAIKSTGQLFVLKDRDNYNTEGAWVAVGGDVSADLAALTARVDTLDKLDNLQATSGLEVAANGSLKVKLDPDAGNALTISNNGLKAVGAEYTLVKADNPADYGFSSNYAARYEFCKNGEVIGEIDIPRDQFLKSAEFIIADGATALEYDLVEGDPYLKFNFQIPDEYPQGPVFIPAKTLVDVYTPGEYIKIESNQVSVNYNVLKAQIATDLAIDTINDQIGDLAEDTRALKDDIIPAQNNTIATINGKVTTNAENIQAISTTVGDHTTEITGIKGTIESIKVRNVNTTAVSGIALTHTDSADEGSDPDTVGISVDLDALASDLKAKVAPAANEVLLSAPIGNLDPAVEENKPNVQDALEYLESQLTTMAEGGITGITTTDNSLSIEKTPGTTSVNINVNPSAIVHGVGLADSDNLITVKDNGKLYVAPMSWEAL